MSITLSYHFLSGYWLAAGHWGQVQLEELIKVKVGIVAPARVCFSAYCILQQILINADCGSIENKNPLHWCCLCCFFGLDVPQADGAQTEGTLWLQEELVGHWCNPQGFHQQDDRHIKYNYDSETWDLNSETRQDNVEWCPANTVAFFSPPDYVQKHWKEDMFFGHQCLNGVNSRLIQRCPTLPSNFPVTNDKVFLCGGSCLTEEMQVFINLLTIIINT